jgi:hypothetical protein
MTSAESTPTPSCETATPMIAPVVAAGWVDAGGVDAHPARMIASTAVATAGKCANRFINFLENPQRPSMRNDYRQSKLSRKKSPPNNLRHRIG